MSTVFYRQWRLVALTAAVIVALGLSALHTIGRQEDPAITNLYATIVTAFPGADPARVEALVTAKIEEELRRIAEVDTIRSTSRTGISVVKVELSQSLSEQRIEQAWSEVRNALSDAARRFPPGVPEPAFDNDRTGAYTAIVSITPHDGVDHAPAILRRYAEVLEDRLRQVSGTRNVRLFGAEAEEIVVTVDPTLLASLGLDAEDVSRAVAAADAKVQAGQVRGDEAELLIEVSGEIDGLQRIRAIPLRQGADGHLVRVGDVAEVRRGAADPTSIAYADGVRAVLVAARMEDGLRVDRWMQAVSSEMLAFADRLPAGLEHRLVFDQNAYTRDRLDTLVGNMMIGAGIVVAVLVLTLGWRAAMVVATVLPLTALAALAVLQAVGVSIHQMSVTGLIVALGLLVDAAIVMTDHVRRNLAAGMARAEAVARSVRRLAVPLLASTVTTILAFLPMAMLPGPAGDFVGNIAVAVIVMLGLSFALALTMTPALAGWMLRDADGGARRPWRGDGVTIPALTRAFSWSVDLALRHKGLAIMGALVLPVIGFGAFPTLTAQFFPGVDRDQFYVQLSLPGLTSIDETARRALQAGDIIAAAEGVEHVHWVVGENAPAFYYNMLMGQDGVGSFAEALVKTTSPAATRAAIPRLQSALDAALPEAQIIVRDLVQGPPVEAPVELRLVGPELETLRRLGDEVRALMTRVPEITHTRATLMGGDPVAVFDLSEDRVRLAGLDFGAVARQLDQALEGAVGGSLVEGTEDLPVRVRVGDATRGSLAAIRGIDVLGPDAAHRAAAGDYPGIPLAALGTLRLEPSQSPIARRDGERVNAVQGFLQLGVLPEEALTQVRALLNENPLALPPGYRIDLGGDADARANTVRDLTSTLGLVVTLTVLTVVLTFNSFRLSLVVGAVCVLSVGLSLLALAVFRYPFGIQALIGVIGSVGVSINAAIILMTAFQGDAEAMAGDLRRMRAIVVGSSRHILSTTLTTVGGFLPLILGGGGFWPPFAVAIAGGVLLSTVVSFYFTPPMFAIVMARPGAPARQRRRPYEPAAADHPQPPRLQAAE